MPHAQTEVGRLYYEETGAGHPVIFCHEFAADHRTWEPQIRQLGRHYRCVTYNALGYAFAERNVRLDEAYDLVDKALKIAPGDPFIMDSMGWVQYRLGHLPEAEDLLRRAYAVRADPEIAVHLGEVLWQKGDKDNAQKMWREAQAKDPKNDTLKNTLARLNQSL